jgi:hypothetical protein
VTSPYERLYEEVLSEWKKSKLADPEERREVIIDAVLARTGFSWLWLPLVESIYDKLFPQPPEPKAIEQDGCPSCGLNDGHHYASCPKANPQLILCFPCRRCGQYVRHGAEHTCQVRK